MVGIRYSYSRIETFVKCPYQFKLRYIDKLKTLPDQESNNALYLGTAIHEAFETGNLQDAIDDYRSNYYILSDQHINEEIKLEYHIPRVLELLPEGECEVEIKTDDFIGYIDRLVYLFTDEQGVKHYEIWDYKYSNNIDRYLESSQLSLYKYYYEKTHPNTVVDHLKFVFIPKVNIRQKFKSKPPETIQEFRMRLREHLETTEIKVIEVDYDPNSVTQFQECCQQLKTVKDFPKNPTRLCNWCQYQEYCESNTEIDYMMNKREEEMYIKAWIYGKPFSGKTTFAVKAPGHYVLNTDGNAQYTTDSYKLITDEVTKTGRMVQRKLAWAVLKEEIEKLEAGSDYETIIVDLVDDTYEMCRLFMYDKLGISHESDDSFRAWDKVRTEYLSTMRRLINLPYNIILISHEDTSKDITKKSGENITAIKPNITDKVANKLAGMVALVGRTISENDEYTLQIKTDEVTFGGGRLGINNVTVPLEWEAVAELFDKK